MDDFGTLVVVDNRTDRTLYFGTSSIGWDALSVPPATYGQAEFVDSGTTVYVFAEHCELVGSVTVAEEDVSLVVQPNQRITTEPPSDRDQVLLDDYVEWAPGCGPDPSASASMGRSVRGG